MIALNLEKFKSFAIGITQLMRPAEWSKSFGNMAVAAVLAWISYGIAAGINELFLFLYGAFIVCIFWSGLYAINDYTDRFEDAKHALKRVRPIPSGRVPANFALFFGIFLVFFTLCLAIFLNTLLAFCLLVMLLNQILYTSEPFKFKKRPVVDLISGSLINPTFRFFSGWVLFTNSFNVPLLGLLFIVAIQFAGYGLYRYMSVDFEKKRSYASSVARYGASIKKVFYASIFVSFFSFIGLFLNSFFKIAFLGFLPLKYSLLLLTVMPFLPFYWKIIMDPKKVSSVKLYKKLYRLLYLNAFAFYTGFLFIYFLVP